MLTREAIGLIAVFITIFVAAVVAGSFVLLSISFVPFFLLLIGLLMEQPRSVEIVMRPVKQPVWVGDTIEIEAEVTVTGGIGDVSLFHPLPPEFELVEGSNLCTCWKGLGDEHLLFSYSLRCPKRGAYELRPIEWESRHVMGLTQARRGEAPDTGRNLIVRPGILNISRIRGERALASSASPVIDIAKIGVATTDFREIREYVPGDPVKNINWKATAKRAGRGNSLPLVNEYEVEGKKAVWIFLDASSHLELGTSIENAFEYCLQSASGVAYYYLDRGYRVGMYIYNGPGKLVQPDSGKKQFHRIWGELTHARAGAPTGMDELPEAIDRCKRYILGYNPQCIVITSLESEAYAPLIAGIKKLASFRRRLRRKLPIMVIGVEGYSLIPEEGEYDGNAVSLLRFETRPLAGVLRSLGASVLEWNPRKESLGTALLRQVKTR